MSYEKNRKGFVHFISHPVAAKRFVEPLVIALNSADIPTEICIELIEGYDKFIAEISCPVIFKSSNLVSNPIKDFKNLIGLICLLAKKKPLAIQAHFSRGALLPLGAAWITGVPVRIYHNHGVPYLGYSGILFYGLKLLERLNCFFATDIITVSDGMRAPLASIAGIKKPIKLFGPGSACGLDVNDFNYLDSHGKSLAKEEYGFDDKSLVFLYVGRPEKRKGFNILIRAFNEIFSGREDVYLLLAGCTGDDIKSTSHDNHKNIHALGTLMDLNPIYDIADIVVLPSFHEGFGYALLEGAAHGCALIASDIPGPDCLVFENINGFLVRPNALIDLKNKLNHFYCNKVELMNMGKNSYKISLGYERCIILSYYKNYIINILNERN